MYSTYGIRISIFVRLREQVKADILQANQQLEENVKQRTQELTQKNQVRALKISLEISLVANRLWL